MVLDNLGATYVELGNNQKAIEVLNQSISLQGGMPNPRREALARVSIGMAYHKLGDNQKALESLNRGLELVRQVNDRANEARTYTALAKVHWDVGDRAGALANLNQALPLAREVNDPLIESPVLYGMMLVNRAQPGLAIFYGKQAVNLLQQVRSDIQGLDKGLQSAFVSSNAVFYHDLADILIAQGRLPEAQQVLDLLKRQEYSDYVRGGDTDVVSPLTLTAAEQKAEQDYEKSTGQLLAAGAKWADLKEMSTRTPEQDKQFKDLSDQLNAASKALNDYYARLYVLFGKDSAANKQVADVKGDVSALEEQLAEAPNTVALYTMVTSDHYRVIVITAHATVAREYAIADTELNKKVSDFEQALRRPSSNPKPLAQELYKILIGPVQADLEQAKATTLVWSLDGVLRYVPMAALYDGQHYLLEKYNTVTITPASIPHLEEKPDVSNLSVVAMGIARKYEDGLPALPAVAGELDDVVKDAQVQGAHGALPGTLLLDGQFTEKAMEDQLTGKHGVVHIASHFVFKPGDDSQSYLLLAGEGGAGFHLTVADFRDNRNLTLRRTDLLTLSACETGMSGSASNGREVDGLGTTAQLKGAKAVISSLWSVNDSSTGELMGDFYKRWADGAGKVTKVEALRKAQLDLLLGQVKPKAGGSGRGVVPDGPETTTVAAAPTGYAHPYYWAPFVLMGNWR
jgi:CHAT domain-containing protein